MLKPTNDPLDVMRRQQTAAQRETRAAQDSGGTEPFQAVRKLWTAILEIRTIVDQMVELFNRMPQNDGRQVDETGWSIDTAPAGGPWTTVATATIPRPSTTNRAAVMAVATAAGTAEAGQFNFAMQGRILINGVASAAREGTLENLVSTVRSSLNLGFFHELSGLGGAAVTIELQLRGRYAEFPLANTASLSVSVGFTKVG